MAAAAVLGKLHAIGGNRNNVAEPAHDAYDSATSAWRALAPIPEARDHVAVAEAGDKVFAFGGFSTPVHKGASADAFEYDPATDTWRRLSPMLNPRGAAAADAVGGEIHVLGGRGPDGAMVAAHDSTIRTSAVGIAAPLPLARDHLAVVAADGRIHVIGGRLGLSTQRSGQHDVYDPAVAQWSSAAPLPTPRSGVAGVLYAGLILVLGGELSPDHTFPENEGYDPNADR